MAITKHHWTAGLALLQEHFRRELSAQLAAVYLEQLGAELDSEEFARGVKWCIRTMPPEFGRFPTIAELVNAARGEGLNGTSVAAADEQTGRAIGAQLRQRPDYSVHGYYLDRARVEREHGTAAVKALDTIGGAARLLSTPDTLLGVVLKDFGQAYVAAKQAERSQGAYQLLSDTTEQRRRLAGARGQLEPAGAALKRALPPGVTPTAPER